MKKILIYGYFIGMLGLTYFVAKGVSTNSSDNVEVVFRKHERELTDSEIYRRGIIPREKRNVVEKWKTKETRTKTLFGWDTKIEYEEKPLIYYVDRGCQ
jgi:hypothetical protein